MKLKMKFKKYDEMKFKKRILQVLSLCAAVSPGVVSAQDYPTQDYHGAVGVGGVFNSRQLVNELSFSQFAPEIVVHGYTHLDSSFWLRPSLRLSYAWNQPEMAQSVQINEYDWKAIAEIGVVWSWVVVPSFSVGVGSILRTTSLVTASPVQGRSNSQIGGTSFLPLVQAQLGLGIPIEKGVIVLEPYARYMHVFGDSRYNWAFGTEATVSVF